MLSSMTPTIVLKAQLYSRHTGGTTIITSVFQTLILLLILNECISDAVNKNFIINGCLIEVDIERLSEDVKQDLIRMVTN